MFRRIRDGFPGTLYSTKTLMQRGASQNGDCRNLISCFQSSLTVALIDDRDGGRGAVRGLGADRDGAFVLGDRLQPPHRGHTQAGGKSAT